MGRTDSCILCRTSIIYSAPEFEGYRICKNCNLTWCIAEDPTDPTDEWEKNYYGRSDVVRLHQVRKSGMEAIVARLSAVCPVRGRLLDVGTGIGTLMQAAVRDGWLAEGIEPSTRAAEWARKLTGCTVYDGLLETANLPVWHYDAVVILDLLRSIPDPLPFLYCARRLLRPGGILLIRDGYRAVIRRSRWLINRSLEMKRKRRAFEEAQCFSPKSLAYALNAVGLECWIEPSPVFVEPASEQGLAASLLRRLVGLSSSAIYQASAQQIIVSPNLLAFGRAPAEITSTAMIDCDKSPSL